MGETRKLYAIPFIDAFSRKLNRYLLQHNMLV